jgi:hypothetical protein
MANWQHRWPGWQPGPDSGLPAERGGCTPDRAYDAGLTPEPGGWVQDIGHGADGPEDPDPESARRMQAYDGWQYQPPDREAG